jgi:hypothetical protein
MVMAKPFGSVLALLLSVGVSGPAWAAKDFAREREVRFMQACLSDATVAAGQRQALCACVRDAFAYGGQTTFGLTDVLTLEDSDWEAPDRRLPRNSLGQEVRLIRQSCLNTLSPARPVAR